jgi:hypothetical protein
LSSKFDHLTHLGRTFRNGELATIETVDDRIWSIGAESLVDVP